MFLIFLQPSEHIRLPLHILIIHIYLKSAALLGRRHSFRPPCILIKTWGMLVFKSINSRHTSILNSFIIKLPEHFRLCRKIYLRVVVLRLHHKTRPCLGSLAAETATRIFSRGYLQRTANAQIRLKNRQIRIFGHARNLMARRCAVGRGTDQSEIRL